MELFNNKQLPFFKFGIVNKDIISSTPHYCQSLGDVFPLDFINSLRLGSGTFI